MSWLTWSTGNGSWLGPSCMEVSSFWDILTKGLDLVNVTHTWFTYFCLCVLFCFFHVCVLCMCLRQDFIL
jgi:hypothetical protein